MLRFLSVYGMHLAPEEYWKLVKPAECLMSHFEGGFC